MKRDHPGDGETLALLGRTLKDEWIGAWRSAHRNPGEMREAAADEAALLLEAARPTPRRFARSPTTFIRGSMCHAWRLVGGSDRPERFRPEDRCYAARGALGGGMRIARKQA